MLVLLEGTSIAEKLLTDVPKDLDEWEVKTMLLLRAAGTQL
jgi:hypothetical protein